MLSSNAYTCRGFQSPFPQTAVYFAKDTSVSDDGRMTVKGSDTAVKTSSGDYSVSDSALQVPGSTVQEPEYIGTAPVRRANSLVEVLTVLDPDYSGCPTIEFKQCYDVWLDRTLTSLLTITFPGTGDMGDGTTVYRVASATILNGTLKIETQVGTTLYVDADAQVSLEEPGSIGQRRLLSTAASQQATITSQPSSGGAYVPSASPAPITPPSADEKVTCGSSFSCIFSTLDLENTQKEDPRFSLAISDDMKIDLFKVFTPASFVKAMASLLGVTLCELVQTGKTLKTLPLDFLKVIKTTSNVIGEIESQRQQTESGQQLVKDAYAFLGDMSQKIPGFFSQMPLVDNEYYLIGIFATGLPGLPVKVDGTPLPNIQVISAFNPCAGDYHLQFNGVKVPIPIKAFVGSLELLQFSYSKSNRISSTTLFKEVWKPW
jgi:hypothetical protein